MSVEKLNETSLVIKTLVDKNHKICFLDSRFKETSYVIFEHSKSSLISLRFMIEIFLFVLSIQVITTLLLR